MKDPAAKQNKRQDKDDHARLLLDLLGGVRPARRGETILDLGCGQGRMVEAFRRRGLAASGCDYADRLGPPPGNDGLKVIAGDPYHLPFPDRSFDYVVSWQVFEHVMDLDPVLREIRRVLAPGGVSLHIFSGRYSILEPHVNVPLATLVRCRPWLLLWAILGVRSPHQAGKGARAVAGENFTYLHGQTRYLRRGAILKKSRAVFPQARFRDDMFIDLGTSPRSRIVQRIARLSPVLRKLIARVYLLRKSQTRVLVLSGETKTPPIAGKDPEIS
jgi:SAM-dependent methyltransferase